MTYAQLIRGRLQFLLLGRNNDERRLRNLQNRHIVLLHARLFVFGK